MRTAIQALQIVQDWHQALNTGNIEQLAALVEPAVELVGPRGSVTGVNELIDWVGRARLNLIPQRFFQQGDQVLVEETGQWHSAETGALVNQQVVATLFELATGRIGRIQRFESLAVAFDQTSSSSEWREKEIL